MDKDQPKSLLKQHPTEHFSSSVLQVFEKKMKILYLLEFLQPVRFKIILPYPGFFERAKIFLEMQKTIKNLFSPDLIV